MDEPIYRLKGVIHSKAELLEDFEGPLDVILLLLSKNKIEIQDVSITAILDQYLAYLDQMRKLDMEIASEFIIMASHLMLIKTKMLLSTAEQQEAQEEMDVLRQTLLERQRKEIFEKIKLQSMFLEQRGEIGRNLFTKAPEPYQKDRTYRYQHSWEDLLRAMAAMAERSANQLPPPKANFIGIVGSEPYPLAQKTKEVLSKLTLKGQERVRQLYLECRSRTEIVATFLALLELCRMGCIGLEDEGDNLTACFICTPEQQKEAEEVGA